MKSGKNLTSYSEPFAKNDSSIDNKVNDPVTRMSVKLSTVIEDTNNKKPRYIFEDPVSMKSPTFNVLENSAKSSYDDFEPIAKQDVSS